MVGWHSLPTRSALRRQPENAWAASAHPTRATGEGSLKNGLGLFRLPLIWGVGMFVVSEQGLSRGVGWALVAHAFLIRRQPETVWAASAHPTRATGKGSLKSGLRLFRLPETCPACGRFRLPDAGGGRCQTATALPDRPASSCPAIVSGGRQRICPVARGRGRV